MKIIEKAAEFIKKGKVKIVGSNKEKMTIQVGDELVILQKKSGRTEYSCSCKNYSRFCKSPILCSHLLAGITFITMKGIKW